MEEQPFDAEKRTAQYVALRDKIEAIKLKHQEELEPFQSALNKLGGLLLEHLNKINADSLKTKAGTPYISMQTSVSIADKTAFWAWANTNEDNMDCVEIRASKTGIKGYMEELQEQAEEDPNIIPVPPPGINYSVRQELNVMRGRKNKKSA